MIDIKTIGSIALRAVRANKLRSTLTSLGIIIGVAAVIVMLAVGNGAQISIQQDMQAMGSNLIIVPAWRLPAAHAAVTVHSRRCGFPTATPFRKKLTQLSMRRRLWRKRRRLSMATPTGQPALPAPTTGIF